VKEKLAEYAAADVDVLLLQLLAFDQKGRLEMLESLPALV
jgi:hypothetical protein